MMLLFSVLLLMFICKVGWFAFRAAWGITKVVVGLVLFPIVLIALVVGGFIYIALPILAIVGICSMVKSIA